MMGPRYAAGGSGTRVAGVGGALLAVLCAALTVGSDTASAQDTISCGQTVSGDIGAPGEQDLYQFSGTTGDVIYFWVATTAATDPGFVAEVELQGPSGPIASTRTWRQQSLTQTGTYTLRVKEYRGNLNPGTRRGAYDLRLEWVAPASKQCTGTWTTIPCGRTQSATLPKLEQDLYQFSGTAGDIIYFWVATTAATDPGFVAEVELFGPSGPIASTTTWEQRTLTETGTYALRVKEYRGNLNPGTRAGAYDLRLEWVGPASKQCTGTWTTVPCGRTQSATLPKLEQDLYQFSGTAGDIIYFWIATTAATDLGFVAEVELFGPSGSIASTTTWRQQSLTQTGTYTLRVKEYRGNLNPGTRAGAYDLRLEWVGPASKQCTGTWTTIPCGQPRLPVALPKLEQDLYQFSGTAGDIIYFWVATTAATDLGFVAEAELFGPSGSIASTTTWRQQSLTQTGTYTLRVKEYRGNLNPGTRAGAYDLRLEWVAPASKQCTGTWTTIPCGQTQKATLPRLDEDLYQFGGAVGDTVYFSVSTHVAIDQGFVAEVELFGPSGSIASTTTSRQQSLTQTGTYTLRVKEYRGNLNPGTRAGAYDLRLEWVAPASKQCPGGTAQSADIRIDPLVLNFDRLGWASVTTESPAAPEYRPSTPAEAARIDVADPQADFGLTRPDHVVIRFRPSEAAQLHAAVLSGRAAGATFDVVPSAALPGLEGIVESLRPSVPGAAHVEAALRADPALESALARVAPQQDLSGVAALEAIVAADTGSRGPMGIFYAKLAAGITPLEASQLLVGRPDVVYAHPSPLVRVTAAPNDPLYPRMWNLPLIGVPSAWDLSGYTLGKVRVAVVDTGVRLAHTELAGRTADPVDVYEDNGDAYADSDPDNDDVDGHGTACAGIVGAIRNNGSLVAGIAPVTIIPVNGYSEDDLVANYWDGIYWGVDHGATVVSLSFGGYRSGATDVELDAMAYAQAGDVLVVAAAGDDDAYADTYYPSAMPYAMSVGAVDDSGIRVRTPTWWWGSNHGATVDITAPGQGKVGPDDDSILTLGIESNTAIVNTFNGTSAATPHVAGVIALLKHINPKLTGAQLRAIVEGTARDQLGDPAEDTAGWDPYHGHGRVDAAAAAALAAKADTQFFTIWNDGDDALNVSSIVLDASAPWLSWSPAAPFNVPGHSLKLVTVTVDRRTAPSSAVTRRLLVSSNDADESPYPGGVYVALTCAPTFSKITPANGSQVGIPVTLSWETSCGASGYEYCYDTTNDGACSNPWTSTANTSVSLGGLSAGTTYYWQVRATNPAATVYANGAPTAYWSFTTQGGCTPGALSVTPADGLTSSGNQGGPFSPSSKSYTLQNTASTGGCAINWTASKTMPWVTLSATGAALAAGASTTVTASINSSANSLAAGSYGDTVAFTNTTNGNGNTTRPVSLTVTGSSPDLIVSALTGPTIVAPGASYTWTVTVKNQGTASAGPSTARLYFSTDSTWQTTDGQIGSGCAVGSLAAGASASCSITGAIPPALGTGKYYVIAKADADNAVAETNETNNTRSLTVYVGPDLIVSALSGPTIIAPGVPVTYSCTTKNQGTASAGASTARLYFSTDTTWQATDPQIGSGYAVGALAAGASASGAITGAIPTGLATGKYYLICKADADSAVVEANETNNTRSLTVYVGPDLAVSALSGPTIVAPGASYTYSVTTKNQGTALAAASTTRLYFSTDTTWQASDQQIGSGCAVGALAAGASASCSITGAIPTGLGTGKYYVIAKADADNAVAEANETNNTKYLTVYVGPDLVVSSLTGPTTVTAGASYTYTATVKNQGSTSAGPSTARLYFSTDTTWQATDSQIGNGCPIGSLAPGASASCSITGPIPAGLATGKYYVIAKADADNAVAEANETNNTKYLTVYVGPDLVISTLSGPSTVVRDTPVTLTVDTSNTGSATAGTSVTRVFISTDTKLDAGDLQLASFTVPAIGAGAPPVRATPTVTVPASVGTGTRYFLAVADATGLVAESQETNNLKSKTITVQ